MNLLSTVIWSLWVTILEYHSHLFSARTFEEYAYAQIGPVCFVMAVLLHQCFTQGHHISLFYSTPNMSSSVCDACLILVLDMR